MAYQMVSQIKKSAVLAVSTGITALSSSAVLADGGDSNPYQPHPPIDTGLAPDSYYILLILTMLIAGMVVVSYGKYLKAKKLD